ncbi:MAG: pilus assembly protein PilP [Nitrosomonas sp.]|nr:pilus assembly protein PilP [Nitrosomonas sp.]MDP1950192.1 pilus assembly protein PilP [Nitrosomonas sp.]
MTKVFHLLLFILSLMLVACSEENHNDLDEFIRDSGKGLRGQVDPVPDVKLHKHFIYEAFDIPSPFIPRQNEQAQSTRSGLQPDLKRRKEVLEQYPLESLRMVGSLEKNKEIFALINSPDGTLHRVSIGNHLGQNFGRIAGISESEVILKEIVEDGVNDWAERVSSLRLENQG